MIKAIFLDYTGTITQENCKAVQDVVIRIVKNSVLKTPQEALSYWWSNLKAMEEASYLDTYKTEDEIVTMLLEKCENEIKLNDNLEELHKLFQDFWTSSPVYPDAKDFFEKCELPIYIVTNNGVQYVQECMRINGLNPAGIICGDMARAYKPHKELFEKALQVSGCQAGEVLHIGDSMSSDVKGALNAGITPVLIDREPEKQYDSVKTIKELTEIIDLII
ncbi:HAD family hydrolase [Hespellia stercorisuis]|uniref:Putative hydrolase of the HAD superfamily n=1 Tax=Hespellia stercorisuis DSM 15480 TaxID=1121950 RepID=A0A1M6MCJ2_9FIRM|nr:HAD family hydrolase [Hespellia stercorisuis]SHJ81176.1 putative hydrolase of the HAD superfamily [Hespellia stercorisuis DSM 15480]